MIEIKVEDGAVLEVLSELLRRGQDLTPAMRGSADVMARAAESAFAHERDPATGAAWHPLRPATIARRQAAGHWPGFILQVSGHLATSIQREYGRDYAAVGTNVRYAAAQQFGRPEINLLPRPFLGLSEQDKGDILEILAGYLIGGIP